MGKGLERSLAFFAAAWLGNPEQRGNPKNRVKPVGLLIDHRETARTAALLMGSLKPHEVSVS
jgi:hypothetical protein